MTSDCIPHQAIAGIGAITPLVRLLLHEESTKAQGKAVGALASIAMGSKDNQTAIAAAGGIAPLVSLLSREHGDEVIAPHGL